MKNKLFALCLLLVCGLCSSVIAADKAIGIEEVIRLLPDDLRTPNRYGLVIGVGQYQDSRIPELSACTNDARQLYNVLTDPAVGMFQSENVTLLLDDNVTRNKVVDALDQLGRKANKEDLVVVYFSGHGAIDGKGRSYWVMQDSRIDSLRATALAETEITELLGEIKTTRLVTLIDACYSASTAKLGKSKSLLDLKRIYPKFTGDGRVAITASKGDQLSVVISDKNHPGRGYSAFTWHLIRAMKGLGDLDKDGVVTVNELWSYVKDRTETTARRQGGNQQPQLVGQMGSKFLLTIDAEQIRRKMQETQEAKELRQKRLEKLYNYYIDGKIDEDYYFLGKELFEKHFESLDDIQSKRLQVFIDVLEQGLSPEKIGRALAAIETPAERFARIQKEKREKCNILVDEARTMDNVTDGKKALELLEGVLGLCPSYKDAMSLKQKIMGYYETAPPDNTNALYVSYPPEAKLLIDNHGYHLKNKPTIYLAQGNYPFSLKFDDGRDTLYGKMKVNVNDDTMSTVFGKGKKNKKGRKEMLFTPSSIDRAHEGSVIRGIDYKITTGDGSAIVAVSYRIGLRQLK